MIWGQAPTVLPLKIDERRDAPTAMDARDPLDDRPRSSGRHREPKSQGASRAVVAAAAITATA